MAKKKEKSVYHSILNFRTATEFENAIIWCSVILLVVIITNDFKTSVNLLPLLVAGAAGTLLINAQRKK